MVQPSKDHIIYIIYQQIHCTKHNLQRNQVIRNANKATKLEILFEIIYTNQSKRLLF